jgi:MFS family permease
MLTKFRKGYLQYPPQFWLLAGASLIDLVGLYLILPFFSLYFTRKFGVNLTQVGYMFATWALAGVIGQALGGALADKFGRKILVINGLIISALSSLAFVLIENYDMIYVTAAIGGLFANSASPARQAMVADLLPENKLSEGYSIMNVIESAALAVGPVIGGLLASSSFILMFYLDIVSSAIAAVVMIIYLKETQNIKVAKENAGQTITQVFRGYSIALQDKLLLLILLLMGFVYIIDEQLYFSVPVYLNAVRKMPIHYYGILIGISSSIAIFFQFPITKRLKKFSFLTIMGVGSMFYALGFGLFNLVSGFWGFAIAFVIIGLGQVFFYPTSHAVVGKMAPASMRGRYMAVFGVAWSFQIMIAPLLGGYLMDNNDPIFIWQFSALILIVVGVSKFVLQATLPSDSRIKRQ